MSAAPFHVLLLAGGNKSPHRDGKSVGGNENPEDYLLRRNEFRKKAASHRRPSASHVVKDETPTESSVPDRVPHLRRLSTPLEMAMAACCERIHRGSPSPACRRSGLHRPLCPANYDQELSNPDISTDSDLKIAKGSKDVSILQSGKEGHFLKLLSMYCPKQELGHRALAMAILQRTIDWEKSKANAGLPSTKIEGTPLLHVSTKRTRSFLAVGGMKLMSKWLVDSYVPAPPPPQERPTAKHNSYRHVASPTGRLLLPLLHYLKSIPFDKELVVSTQIHKSIKRLKKALDTLVKANSETPDSLEKVVHPVAGGLNVGRVVRAVDSLMASWSEAAATTESSPLGENTAINFDPFQRFRKLVHSRFEELSIFRNNEAVDPPTWLPKRVALTMRRVPNYRSEKSMKSAHPLHLRPPPKMTVKAQDDVAGKQTGPADPKVPSGERLPNDSKVRSRLNATTMRKLYIPKDRKRKVSWADRPLARNKLPRPLKEERYFIQEPECMEDKEEKEVEEGNHDGLVAMERVKQEEDVSDLDVPAVQGIQQQNNDNSSHHNSTAQNQEENIRHDDKIEPSGGKEAGDDSDMEDLF